MLVKIEMLAESLTVRLRAEDGQTLAEYGMLLAVVVIVVLAAALLLGPQISALYNQVAGLF
jgi:pilus assembly protein Flp/PilA